MTHQSRVTKVTDADWSETKIYDLVFFRRILAAAELDSSRCWPPNRRSLGGTPPSRTPPASGVRGDMPTKGALTGLHGGYSEPGAGAARSAGATQMTCARGGAGWRRSSAGSVRGAI